MDLDNHPIPQDVTHFQFKLIGEMTLKQFGYLAGGVGMAWLIFILPINIFVKLPISLIYAGTGILLAFIPIEGRPADTMIKNFVRALLVPNQFLYKKESSDPILSTLFQDIIQPEKPTPPAAAAIAPPAQQVQQTPQQPVVHLEAAPAAQQAAQPAQPAIVHTQATPYYQQAYQSSVPAAGQENTNASPNTPPEKNEEKEPAITEQATLISHALEAAKAAENTQQGTPEYEQAHQKVLELEEQLSRAATQKQQLEQELLTLRQQITTQQAQKVYTPSTATAPQETQNVRKIPTAMSSSLGMPSVPDVPNLITGIIKDSRGNVLPSILIEVKDSESNPVRAFKTNQLGQFASATPLLNGTYTVYFEDPAAKHKFETIEIVANGEIMMPIEIISVDQREELRKELFG